MRIGEKLPLSEFHRSRQTTKHLYLENLMRLFSVLFALFLLPMSALAQNAFEGTQGDISRAALPIYGGGIEDIITDNSGNLYAGVGSPNGIFCSTDGGATWDGPPSGSDFGSLIAVAAGGTDGTVFFIGGIDLYRSTDGCQTFEQLTASSNTNDFDQALVFANDTLIAAYRDGTVEVSDDSGDSFTNRTIDGTVTSVKALAAGTTAGTFFALAETGGGSKLYKSVDSGVNWAEVTTFAAERSRLGVSPEDEDIIVVASNDVVEISTDGGTSFNDRTPGGLSDNSIRFATVSSNPRIFVGANFSEDNGATWTNLNDSATTESELRGHLIADPTDANTFYMSSSRGVTKSSDSLANWTDVVEGMLGVTIADIAQATDKDILFLAGLGGIAKTTNYLSGENATWTYPIDVDGNGTAPTALFFVDPDDSTTLLAAAFSGIYRSTDTGDTWTATDTAAALENRDQVQQFAKTANGNLYAAFNKADDDSGGVSVSTDGGLTWTDTSMPNDPPVNAIIAVENTLFAGVGAENTNGATQRGVYKFEDDTWTQLSGDIDGQKINDLAYNGSRLFASAGDVSDGGIFGSDDLGDTWDDLGADIDETRCLQTLSVNPENSDNVFVAFGCPAGTAVVYESQDSGASWEVYYTGLKDEVPSAMLFDDLIVGLNTGAYELNSDVAASSLTFTGRLRKQRNGTIFTRFTGTAKDANDEVVADLPVQLQYRKNRRRDWRDRGRQRTTNSKGKARWKTRKKGLYRIAVPDSDLVSRQRRFR